MFPWDNSETTQTFKQMDRQTDTHLDDIMHQDQGSGHDSWIRVTYGGPELLMKVSHRGGTDEYKMMHRQ